MFRCASRGRQQALPRTEATLAGAGVALPPKLLVADDVAAGRLVQWGAEDAPPVQIWALQNSRRLVGAKVRAFLDLIDQSLGFSGAGRP